MVLEVDLPLDAFDAIVYINLDHRKDRKKLLLEELRVLDVHTDKIFRQEAFHEILNGHLGCAKSHKSALEMAKKNCWNNVLILEDDVFFKASKEELKYYIKHFLAFVAKDWDVFFLGANVFESEKISFFEIHRVLKAQCAHAYAVNRRYYDTLIECYQNAIDQMEEGEDFEEARFKAIDQRWKVLQPKGLWYISKMLCQQRRSYSDIEHTIRERIHPDLDS